MDLAEISSSNLQKSIFHLKMKTFKPQITNQHKKKYNMKARQMIIGLLLLIGILPAHADNRKTCIDDNWKFHYGTANEAISPNFDDSSWRTINLPHDWSVETEAAEAAGGEHIGPFSRSSIGSNSTGQTVGGEGWYRKKFTLDNEDKNKRIMLYFEGAYNHSTIWLNGRKIYFNHYGYQSFRFDATEFCNAPGKENTLTVKVTNNGINTRWYAGSGIYRHVWLIKVPQIHLDNWRNFIYTSDVSDGEATVNIETWVKNEQKKKADSELEILIYDKKGNLVASDKQTVCISKNGYNQAKFQLHLDKPLLWSPETPNLYKAHIKIKDLKNGISDQIVTHFGVRTLEFSAEKGFLLNGKSVLLQGGCIHHDNGLLGAAAYDAAENRKITLLKNEGFNALRTAHNIPSEHFLDACDSIGMMVIDESFDQWLRAKNKDDYHQYFEEYSDRDMQTMILRDRNHPSIIMWSIGNEIPGRITTEGQAVASRLRNTILSLDSTRAITAAIPGWDDFKHSWNDDNNLAFKSLDVGGYNYLYDKYESDHNSYPGRVMVGLETYPKRASENWILAEKLPYVIGDFVWTAMDYLGEAGIGSASFRTSGNQPFSPGWPWFNGWCGDIDLIGTKKPQSYYRDVVWHRKPITMAVEEAAPQGTYQSISAWGWQLEHQSWTWNYPQGTKLTVNVYSRSPQVRLYLNGKLIGTKTTSATFWAGFNVPYEPGILKAVEYDGQNEGASFTLKTTGTPVGIRLRTDRSSIASDGNDLAYITAELIDEDGQVVYDSQRIINFDIEGEGKILASGNGCPNDMESFRNLSPKLYNGRAQAIVQSTRQAGKCIIKVTSEGLDTQSIIIKTSNDPTTALTMPSSDQELPFQASSRNGRIYVYGTSHYKIYDANGTEVPAQATLAKGIYIVKADQGTIKLSVK